MEDSLVGILKRYLYKAYDMIGTFCIYYRRVGLFVLAMEHPKWSEL